MSRAWNWSTDLKLPTQILESDVSLRAKCTKHETIWEIRDRNEIKEKIVIPATTGNGVE